MSRSNPETAVKVFQSSLNAPRVDAAEVFKGNPTVKLNTKDSQFLEIDLYDVQANRIDHSKFQSLNKAACAMMYAGLMCLCLSFMCCEFHCTACICRGTGTVECGEFK